MAERDYAPYFTVAAEGHRIGLMLCRRCGATLMVTEAKAMPENAAEIHDQWHAAHDKPLCALCEHDEWTHNLSGDGRCIPECGCRAFRAEGDWTIGHVGRFVMPSGEWECDDDCPHLSHERPEA